MTEPTKEELLARIAELEKQSGAKKTGRMEFRVSEKGGVSVYGLGRFPVTQDEYARFIRATGHPAPDVREPPLVASEVRVEATS